MKRDSEIGASRSSPRTMPIPRPLVAWTSLVRPRVAAKRWVSVVSGLETKGRSTTVSWPFTSVTQLRAFKCCSTVRYTCRKAGPMTPRAEKELRAGGGRIPDQTDARAVPNRSRLVQRSVRFRLGFRRVVRSGQQVSRWLRIAEASIRRRDSNQLSWLGSEAKGVAKRPEKVGKTRPSQEVSTCSSSPAFKRSPESVEVLT